MNPIDFEQEFPGLQPAIREIAAELQTLILRIFPAAVVSRDGGDIGYGYGQSYRGLVFTVSPHREHITLGIANGAALEDPDGLMQGKGKVHRHVKLTDVEQVRDPRLEALMLRALRAAQERGSDKGG